VSKREEIRSAILGLAGATAAADDQAQAMSDAELAQRLLTGRWSTIEVHEAGLRLMRHAAAARAPEELTA
jgi:ribonuclease HI